MAADIGTLQRLPFIIGNDSFVRESLGYESDNFQLREIAYTGRIFESDEALRQGLVSQVYKTREELLGKLMLWGNGVNNIERKCFQVG